jgi:hypothetical protein
MRTSARKNFCLLPRIAKEIPRESDRASRERNFTAIAMSRESALRAIVRDRNFFVAAQFRQANRATRSAESKKFFARASIVN